MNRLKNKASQNSIKGCKIDHSRHWKRRRKYLQKKTQLKLTTLFPQARKPQYLKSGRNSTEVARPCHGLQRWHGQAVPTLQWWHGQPVSLFCPPSQFLLVALPALAIWHRLLYVALPAGLAFFKNSFLDFFLGLSSDYLQSTKQN